MLIIDNRTGSKELLPHFPKGTAELGHLEFGDVAFLSTYDDDHKIRSVGIERKALSDLLNSMSTGRLAAVQLGGLTSSYDIVYLIVEGVYKVHPDGRILVPKGAGQWASFKLGKRQFTARELDGFMNTLSVEAGVVIRETNNMHRTAMLVYNLHRWWQKKDHVSLLAMHKHRFPDDGAGGVILRPPSLVRRIAAELPGIGNKRSLDVATHFGSVEKMVNADEEEWQKVPGVGKTTASRVVEGMRKVC